jgi:ATP-dependent helicase/nuclease subunit A
MVHDLPGLLSTPAITAARPRADDANAAALGSAVHRVLEWVALTGTPSSPDLLALALASTKAFGVDARRAADIAQWAGQILSSPECKRFFDARALAWAGNEVPVVVDGQTGRIDRLVAFDGPTGRAWWVLDYKLNAAPEQADANRAQLSGYVEAVHAMQPGDEVHGAFITAAGILVPLDT